MNDLQKRSWAEISLPNIRHNYEAIRAALPEGCRFLGVVKADAYGHGALPVSRLLQEAGADYLAVSCLDEALELRRGGITMPILILGHTPPEYTGLLIEEDLTQTVSALAKAKEYSFALAKALTVWVRFSSIRRPVYSGGVWPRIRMGMVMPPRRSSSASSRQLTAR